MNDLQSINLNNKTYVPNIDLISKQHASKINVNLKILKNNLFKTEEELKSYFLENENENEIRNLLDKYREIIGILHDNEIEYTEIYPNNKNDVMIATDEIRIYTNFWCSRIVQDDFSYSDLKSYKISNYFFDHKIPLKWNWEYDLFIVINPNFKSIIKSLSERSFKNLIIINKNLNEEDVFPLKKFRNFYLNKNLKEIEKSIHSIPGAIGRISLVDCEGSLKSKELLHKTSKVVEEIIQSKHSIISTQAKFNDNWNKNLLMNLKYFKTYPFINQIEYKGVKSSVVVGTGPSLEKNIKILRDLQQNVLIITCLHALPVLTKNGISPDIVFHIHPTDGEGFEKLTRPLKTMPINNLILDTTASNYLFEYPAKKIFHYPLNLFFSDEISQEINYNHCKIHGSNIIQNCISLCEFIGIKNLTLIGNDLSFPNDMIYSKGAQFKTALEKEKQKEIVYTDGYNGGTVKTTITFKEYIKELSFKREELKEKGIDIKLYNSSEGGALIPGFKKIKLKNFINKFGLINAEKKISIRKLDPIIKNQINHKIKKFYNKTEKDFETILKILKKLMKISSCKKINSNSKLKSYSQKLTNKLMKLNDTNWFVTKSATTIVSEFYHYNRNKFVDVKESQFYLKLYKHYNYLLDIIKANKN